MAVGALGAYILFTQRKKFLSFVYHPVSQFAAPMLIISSLFFKFDFLGYTLIEALIFIVFILNVSTNPKYFLKLENRLLNYLGNISYGLYMYHTICIALLFQLLLKLGIWQDQPVLFNIIVYILSPVLTVLIAGLSYRYFESFFLKLKDKFMVVKSSTQL